MRWIVQKTAGASLALAALLSFHSCTHRATFTTPVPEAEVWEMDVTGGTVAKFKLLLKRTEIQKGVYSIHGEFSGMADDDIGGFGRVECEFHGTITSNSLKADFSGRADMKKSLFIRGDLRGTLSDSEGRGEYHASHEEGRSDGRWNMKRTAIPKQ